MVVQVMANMGQVGHLGSDSLDNFQGFVDAVMGRVRLIAQAVQNQNVQSFQVLPRFVRNKVGVGTVSHVAETKSKYLKVRTMLQTDRLNLRSQNLKRFETDRPQLKLWHGAGMGLRPRRKCIIECMAYSLLNDRFTIQRYRSADRNGINRRSSSP